MNRTEVLDRAKEIITGQRMTEYGKPEDNGGLIAEMWSAHTGKTLDAVDSYLMMAEMKIARIISGTATQDSFVDAIGYIALACEMKARLEE